MSGDQRTVIKGNPSQYVKLNVGGSLYYTTIGTLTKMQETMLHAMFSGRMEVLTDSEGWILIDRCGKHFGTILNYLRDGNVSLPNTQEVEEILAEAKFYCIQGLANHCEKTMETRKMGLGTICQVPFITSEEERKLFIAGATKPVVELLINRHNNKYSYTSTSDENLLKNLEMFDRLALRFNGRIHFIKDAIGPSEICCWRFYGNGKKFAEVCCTSIVYATDRKHTKVEFPEARIYEETLNSFLYENRPGPDQELMRATSVRGGGGVVSAVNCTSDEEEDRLNRRIGHKLNR
jgi:BTB/POZ domain-containing adapter for CUL3-mediated RhoA degradation protein